MKIMGYSLLKVAFLGLCVCAVFAAPKTEEKKEGEKGAPKTLAEHFDAEHHDSKFDHGAILGSLKEIDAFGKMSKNESQAKLGEYFDKMDTDKDGYLTAEELEKWVQKSLRTLDSDMAKERFGDVDKDKDGKLIWSEYLHEAFGVTPEEYANMTEVDKQDHDSDLTDVPYEQKKFNLCDKNKDGHLDINEFYTFSYPQDDPEVAKVEVEKNFNHVDANKDGSIDLKEYFGDEYEDRNPKRMEKQKKIFEGVDKNGDGKLDFNEYQDVVLPSYESISKKEAAHLIQEGDTSKDGKLTKVEVQKHFKVFGGSKDDDDDDDDDHHDDDDDSDDDYDHDEL